MGNYTDKITFRLTQKEYETLKKEAAKKHLDVSKYVRATITNNPYENKDLVEECRNLNYEINRIGNNINQIANRHNANLYHPDDIEELKIMLNHIWDLVHRLRKEIMR